MYPKDEINKLNRQREIQAKLRFARRRMLETVVELQYFRKKISELPEGMALPPAWAEASAHYVTSLWMRPFAKLTPEEIRANPRGVVRELLGLFDAMVASIVHIAEDLPPELRRTEEGRTIKLIAAKLARGDFKRHLERLEKAMDQHLPKPTHRQLIEHAQSYERGLTEYFDPEEELLVTGMGTLSAQLYYLTWFFWPRLVTMKRLRAIDLRKFLYDQTGLQFSEKLTEKIYSDVGLGKAKEAT